MKLPEKKPDMRNLPELSPDSTREIFMDAGPGNYLVSINHGARKRTEKWNAKYPFPLNYPPTIFLEKDEAGIRVVHRSFEDKVEKEEQIAALSEPLTPGRAGAEVEIGDYEGATLSLQLARVIRSRAAYLPMVAGTANPYLVGENVYVSCGVHGLLSAFECVDRGGVFAGQVERYRIFKLMRTSKGAYVSAIVPGAMYKLKGKPAAPLSQVGQIMLSETDLQSLKISFGDYWWRFNRLSVPVYSHLDFIDERVEETSLFKKTMWGLAGCLTVALGLAFLAPKKEEAKVDILKEATRIELKKPKQIAAKPTPKPTEPPKRVVMPKEAPKPKLVEKKVELPKPEPKKEAPKKLAKKVKPKNETPKLVAKPLKREAPKVVDRKPAPARPAAVAPKLVQVAKVPPPPRKPEGPTPDQLKAAKEAQARADLAKSLGFLATTPSKTAPVQLSAGSGSKDAKYAKLERNSIAGDGKPSTLSNMAKNVGDSASGPIDTTSARSVASESGIKGRSKGLNEVQGKVTLAALYGSGGASAGSSVTGGMSVSGPGNLEDSSILKTLSKYLDKFQYCYEKLLLSKPTAAGTLTMEWTIGTAGATSGAKVVRSELSDEKLHSCMSKELGKIRFQPPRGGSVIVKYPFSFSSSSL